MADTANLPVIFLAFANDRQSELRYLRNLPDEARQLREALEPAERAGLCEVVVRANSTADDIFRVFQDDRYRNRVAIFHYGGHANGYQLLLESSEGQPVVADAGGLAAFLGQQRGMQLVFLNGCSTQRQARGLLDANVAAVIATSRAIDDDVATDFSCQFYQGLAGGAGLQKAFNEAEAAVQTARGSDAENMYSLGDQVQASDSFDPDRWPWILHVRDGSQHVTSWNLPNAVDDPLFGLPPLPPQDLPESPYRHLKWFTHRDAEVFFGRGRPLRNLYDRITAPGTAPIVLFYGQSGVGKSSLLDAGLFPRLEQSHAVCYLRRLDTGLLATLRQAVLPENAEAPLATAWFEREQQLERPLVVFLDQVEEAYTRPHPDLPDELDQLLNFMQDTFGDHGTRPQGKLVLGFRKEWLAELEARLSAYELPRTRVFLEPLDRRGIIEIVEGPSRSERLRQRYGLTVEEGLAEVIADDLLADRDSAIAPTLQILLTKMWNEATQACRDRPRFSHDLYDRLRRQGILLRDFLTQQIEAFRRKNSQTVDSGLLLDVMAQHTTALGTADQRSVPQLEVEYSHLGDGLPGLLQECKDLYLLTLAAQQSDDPPRQRTRLAHDTLAPLVRERFDESDRPGQTAQRILVNRAVAWQNGQEGTPLDEADLQVVENGREGMRAWTADEQRLIDASRKRRNMRRRQRRLIWTAALAAVAVIAVAGVVAVRQWWAAQCNLVTAHFLVAGSAVKQGRPADVLYWDWRAYHDAPLGDGRKASALGLIGAWSRSLGTPLRHADTVAALSVSPDGRTVLTGSYDGTAQLWELKSGLPLGPPLEHEGTVRSVAISRDGKTLLTASDDHTARLWDAATGKGLGPPLKHRDRVAAAAFSPDGQTVLTGSHDGTARLWDAASGSPLGVPLAHDAAVVAQAFLPDGQTVITGSWDGTARRWNAETGDPQGPPLRHGGRILDIDVTPNGQTLVTAGDDGTARLWNLSTGQPAGDPLPHDGEVVAATFGPAGKSLLTGSADKRARLWDVGTGELLTTPLEHEGAVVAVAFSPDGKTLLTGSRDNAARLWEAATGKQLGEPLRHEGSVVAVAFTPDGHHVVTGSWDNTARLWNTAAGQPVRRLPHPGGKVRLVVHSPDGQAVLTGDGNVLDVWEMDSGKHHFRTELAQPALAAAFSPDGRLLAVGGRDNTARLLNATNGKLLADSLKHEAAVVAVAFSPDATTIVTGSQDGTARLWNVPAGTPRDSPLEHQGTVRVVEFSPDGATLLTAGDDATAVLRDASTGQPRGPPLVHKGPIVAAAFSPNGRLLITGSEDNTAQIWDTSSGKKRGPPLLHNEPVVAVAFSPDATLAMTGSEDNTARLWHVATGEPCGESLRHELGVEAVAFSPDGQVVVTGSDDGTAQLWDAATGQPRGGPLRHPDRVVAVAFAPDGRSVLTGSWADSSRWLVAPPAADDAKRLQLSVEVRTGYYTDAHGVKQTLNSTQWLDRKRRLATLGGACDLRSW